MFSALKKAGLVAMVLGAGVSACQSPTSEQPSASLDTHRLALDIERVEALQWVEHPAGERKLVVSETQGLYFLDSENAHLAHLAGTFETLDHRAGREALLVASFDTRRQQAFTTRLAHDGGGWADPVYLPPPEFKIDGVCFYRDGSYNSYLFLIGEQGVGEQWLVAQREQPLKEPVRVRPLSLPPESEYCSVDDQQALLFINEESVGLWAYEAHPEAELQRHPVDLRRPFGSIEQSVAGVVSLDGGLLAVDADGAQLHSYQQVADRQWRHQKRYSLELDEPEWLSARPQGNQLAVLIRDDEAVHQATLDWQPEPRGNPNVLIEVSAQVQTQPVPSVGDAADDPAIWVNRQVPEQSRVLGTDKRGGLGVYDLQGQELQFLALGRLNNVDLRYGFQWGDRLIDLAAVSNRDRNSLHLFSIDPKEGTVSELSEIATTLDEIYGLCMYQGAQGEMHVFANDKNGRFVQHRLRGDGVTVESELVREFRVETQPEGCVASDKNHLLYLGEESEAVWVLDARAEQRPVLERVVGVDGERIVADIEGLALYEGVNQEYLIISSQGNDSYVVIEAKAPYRWRGAFRIGMNAEKMIDGTSETDGVEATAANLGGIWGQGMLVVQDGRNRLPDANQNYKYVPWSAIAEALELE